ncbi:MAG: CDP-glycerol glycerophosphotransferase family protein [Muribaculaceae bacterium]|nr:CDP-glycerol glycerophosphotransferase family protein [Muribaculaceae bacterium]
MLNINKDNNFLLFLEHLKLLKEKLVFIAAKDTIGFKISDEQYELLNSLGLNKLNENRREIGHWKGYISVIDDGNVIYEEISSVHEDMIFNQSLYGYDISIYSSPLCQANCCSMMINGKEYAVNQRGLNFAVLDKNSGRIEESVAFDTHADNIPCHRDEEKRSIRIDAKKRNKNEIFLNNLNEVRRNLNIKTILGSSYDALITQYISRIKIRFFYWGSYVLWLGLRTVAEEFAKDSRFDVLVVINNIFMYEKKVQVLQESNVNYIIDFKYKINDDRPDIVVYNMLGWYRGIQSQSQWKPKLKIHISPEIINGIFSSNRQSDYLDNLDKNDEQRDFCIVEKNIYNACVRKEGSNILPMGNPKIDIIVPQKNNKKELPEDWKKLNGKKIILWAFDHNWNTVSCTFDLYIKAMFGLFARIDEGLIIRPHANYLQELIKNHLMEENDLNLLRLFCKKSKNIVWDETLDYSYAYSIADAVITDINCGISISALPLDIPVAVLERYDGNHCEPLYPEVYQSLYKIRSLEDLEKFTDMVAKEEHPMKQQQNDIRDKYIANVDGKNGQRIKDFIVKSYFDKIER